MEDETKVTPETTDVDDFGDIDFDDTENISEEPTEDKNDEPDVNDNADKDGESTDPKSDEADPADQTEGEADKDETDDKDKPEETDQFTLKHLDEVKTVSRDEVITLAQKGMDYDHLRSKSEERYNELEQKTNARLAVFDEIAKQGGFKDIDDLAENTLAQQLAEREGIDTAAALKQVRLDKREKELSAKEQGLKTAKDAKSKVDADARAFVEKYPNVDFKTIPKEVWDKVNNGNSLVTAYGDHINEKSQKELTAENEKLKAELEAAKKNADNKARSTGSAQTSGKSPKQDDFIINWDD